MRNKELLLFFSFIMLLSCSKSEIIPSGIILSDYLRLHDDKKLDEVIACAGSKETNIDIVFVYYYPIKGSSEYRYYETDNANVDPNNFANYTLKNFSKEPVLGNKLARFNRDLSHEAWGIVTFLSEGKVHKSNPIRLKQKTKPTIYNTSINIDNTKPMSPKFSWNASLSNDDVIYFQALVNDRDGFISGTYTTDLYFRYYDTSNVVLTINTAAPPKLDITKKHTITILGVSEDNWVNLHAEKIF